MGPQGQTHGPSPMSLGRVLVLLSFSALLAGCIVAVRPGGRGRCWHKGWRGPEGVWHRGHWGPCP